MQRVLKSFGVRFLFLLLPLLALAQSSLATTVVVPTDDDMIVGARAILRGKVVAIDSSFDENHRRIYTYVTVKVQEVIKGSITERFVVLKELGGQVGLEGLRVFGNPQFTRGERVVLYLDTWKDGSLRTHQMFLGKFSITADKATGKEVVVRGSPDENVDVRPNSAQSIGAITDRMELSSYLEMLRGRVEANLERSRNFEDTYYHGVPLLAEPGEFRNKSRGGIELEWTYISPTHPRWFEPDTGQQVTFVVNTAGAPQSNIVADVNAAMNAWSTVPNCALRVASGGTTSECSEGVGLNLIQFSGCDGRWTPGGGCSGVLALGGLSWFGGNTKIINGVTFVQATAGFVSINPNAACFFTSHCNIQEVLTHELGHAMGLGHSTDTTATMYAFAHFDNRCASVMSDDSTAVQFIYPGTGGGPGPLTVTTTSLANGAVSSTYSQTLQASGGTQPYSWSLVSGLGNLPPGLSLNASTGVISGTPTTASTYNFTVKVTDAAPTSAQKALSIVVNAGGGAALDSQFVSQSVPTTLQPGQSFNANMKFLNTGTQTWSGSAFYLASQNPPLNQTWGGNGVTLSQFSIPPGQQLDLTFSAVAPTTPGTYNFQWQLYQNGGIGFFGQISPNIAVQVGGGGGTDGATFVSQSVPTSMMKGQTYSVSVTMNNSGTTTWAAGTYYLGSQNPAANNTWGLNRINLSSTVLPGAQTTFTFSVVAPSTAATYNFQWQMAKDSGGSFGGMSTNLSIVVSSKKTRFDFDGDNKVDVAVFRPATGMWNIINSSTGSSQFSAWGTNGDKLVAADYDGDGKTDLAVFRPSSGVWFIKRSSTGSTSSVGWGLSTDVPVPGDYDGDGIADVAVYRPSNGVWYVLKSSTGLPSSTGWGIPGDVPVPGDYDGDGRTDIAVYRPSTGVWYIIKSSDGSTQFVGWGVSSDQPVPGDFDGDGRTDIAVWRPSNGVWYIINSATGSMSFVGWGLTSDIPVAGDYDGDGKCDVAVFRASAGMWFFRMSSTGSSSSLSWGQNGDLPVPAN